MALTTAAFSEDDWVVKDVGLERRGYDLLLTQAGDERYVEVKGTTGASATVEVNCS